MQNKFRTGIKLSKNLRDILSSRSMNKLHQMSRTTYTLLEHSSIWHYIKFKQIAFCICSMKQHKLSETLTDYKHVTVKHHL